MTSSDPASTWLAPEAADVLLADGSIAIVRPLRPEDREGLRQLHEGVTDDSLRMRFFNANRRSGDKYVDHLFPDGEPVPTALVASRDGRIVALATAEPVDRRTSEVAFLVADLAHGHGLGSLLLEHLAAMCRDRGITTFHAEVLAENHAMLQVFAAAGFAAESRADAGVVIVTLDTAASPAALLAADERESRAEARSLAPLMRPRSVAVLGCRREPGGIGRAVLRSIRDGGFTGRLYVVHPVADAIDDLPTAHRLADIGEHVDLAVIAVPADRVLDAMRDAAEAGVSIALVITSGFSELGREGARVQQEMLEIARAASIRIIGPNCLGVMANQPGIRLNATFTASVPPPGGLAVASQSGGVGIALMDIARELGLGLASFISLGNKADVSGNDLLAAWLHDPDVTVAALYLESFGNAAKFARIARRFAERKPLLAVVGGRSAGGQRAGASHTAAAASPSVGVDALFAQAGVIGCRSAGSLARSAVFLQQQPLPQGRRIAVLSNAGGMGVLTADAADERGLSVPEFGAGLQTRIARHVNNTVGTGNPIDLGAGASAADVAGAVTEVLTSDEVDALIVVLVATSVADPAPLLDALARARHLGPDKPVVLVAMGNLLVTEEQRQGVTVFHSPEHAVEAVAHAVRYAEWLRVPRQAAPPYDIERADHGQGLARDLLERDQGRDGWVDTDAARALLAPYGIEPVGEVVFDPAAAADAARRAGFPVVVKVADPTVVHKTDRGLVRVGLGSPTEVSAAVQAFETELGHSGVPVLVQPLVDGVEVALGIVRDPAFGPMVMVAAGGITVNLWNDRAFLLPPFTRTDAGRALRSLRSWPLLDGFRGAPRVDVEGLERVVEALGAFATEVPQVAELDLNPVVVTATAVVAVDVKLRLAAPGTAVSAFAPRQLRRPR